MSRMSPTDAQRVDVIPFAGNLVARKDVYVDSMSFLRALGFRQVEL